MSVYSDSGGIKHCTVKFIGCLKIQDYTIDQVKVLPSGINHLLNNRKRLLEQETEVCVSDIISISSQELHRAAVYSVVKVVVLP